MISKRSLIIAALAVILVIAAIFSIKRDVKPSEDEPEPYQEPEPEPKTILEPEPEDIENPETAKLLNIK